MTGGKWLLCMAGIVLLWAVTAGAQDSARILDLKQVLAKTLAFNNDINKSSTSVVIAAIGVRQAKANFLPSAVAGADLTDRIRGRTGNGSATVNVSAGMTVFNGFSTVASLHSAKSSYRASLGSFEVQKQQIRYAAFEGYVQAVLDSELVRIRTENLKAETALLEKIEAFQKSGQRSISDVLTQKTAAEQAELALVNARHDYAVSKLTLLQLMGDDSLDINFRLTALLPDSAAIAVRLSSDTTLSVTLTRRKDVEAEQHTADALRAQETSAKSGYWPSLALSSGMTAGSSGGSPAASVGISLSVPLFDRFTAKNNVAVASAKVLQEENNRKELRRQVVFEVKKALLDYHAAEDRFRVTRVATESAQRALEAVQARYDVGAATLTDLIQSRSGYLAAMNDGAGASLTLALRTVGVGYYCGAVREILELYTGAGKN
jgi:outer membrane protein